MKCRVIESIVILITVLITNPRAQSRPNFAGKWTVVSDKTTGGGDGGCPPGIERFGQEFRVEQTPTLLTIERLAGSSRAPTLGRFTYKLDGSESKNQSHSGDAVSKLSWTGGKLTISTTTVFDTGGGDVPTVTMKTTHVLSLEPNGLLNVALTIACRDHAAETTTVVYKKVS